MSLTAKLSVDELFDVVRGKIQDRSFLEKRGLANEVSTYVLPYDAGDELTVRRHIEALREESERGNHACRLVVRDLWDSMLAFLGTFGITPERVAQLEATRGEEHTFKQIEQIASPLDVAKSMDWQPHQPNDVLLLCGVGKAYPFLRASGIFNNIQTIIDDVPIILAYPGTYNGRELALFGKLDDANYYRAFNLITGK